MSDTLITAKNLTMSIRNNVLLDHANIVIHSRKRIALVGRNGAGKSTLFQILQAHVQPDAGDISYKKNLTMAELSQTVPTDANLTCEQVLMHGKQATTQQVSNNLLKSLDLTADHLFTELSGGQKRRLLLAKAMQLEPDLLFLDEPTNHLDIPTIHQLLNQLKRFQGTCLFVSHDRWFIEQLADSIIDLDQGQLTSYPGSFSEYLVAKEESYKAQELEQSLRKAKLKREERWLQRGVTGRRKRNQGRLTKLKALREQYRTWQKPKNSLKIDKHRADKSGKKVFDIKELGCQMGDKILFKNFTQTVFRGEKIGIIGANGVGKTTLVKCMLGHIQPTFGTCELGTKLEISYFDQHRMQLDSSLSVFDNIAGGSSHIELGGKSLHVMQYLQRFLFTGSQAQGGIDRLSGGEKNRLMLAKCLAKPANLLILDEPTNDLDMDTLEILEDFLVDYSGTVFVISHDQMFLDHMITSAWVLDDSENIDVCDGQIEAWQQKVSQMTLKSTTKLQPSSNTTKKATNKIKLSYHQQRRLNELPGLIEKKESELEALCTQLQDPTFFQQPTDLVKKHQVAIKNLEGLLSDLYTQWEELEQIKTKKTDQSTLD